MNGNKRKHSTHSRFWQGCLTLLACTSAAGELIDSGDYRFRLCEPVLDERLLPLAVNNFEDVHVEPTKNAMDFCEEAFQLNWRIENYMQTKICVLDKSLTEPLVRVDHVLSTRKLPKDPHNLALEDGLKETMPLVTKLSFQGDLIVLENESGGKMCLALEKIEPPSDDSDGSENEIKTSSNGT